MFTSAMQGIIELMRLIELSVYHLYSWITAKVVDWIVS